MKSKASGTQYNPLTIDDDHDNYLGPNVVPEKLYAATPVPGNEVTYFGASDLDDMKTSGSTSNRKRRSGGENFQGPML
jgi:hypothetical protein